MTPAGNSSTLQILGLALLTALMAVASAAAQQGAVFVEDDFKALQAQASGLNLPTLGAASGAPVRAGIPVFGRTKVDPRLSPVAYRQPSATPMINRPVPAQPPKKTTGGGFLSRMSGASWFSRGGVAEEPTVDMTPPNAAAVTQALFGANAAAGQNYVTQTSRITNSRDKLRGPTFNPRSNTPTEQAPKGGLLRRWWGSGDSAPKQASQQKPQQHKQPVATTSRAVPKKVATKTTPKTGPRAIANQRLTTLSQPAPLSSKLASNSIPVKPQTLPQPKSRPIAIRSLEHFGDATLAKKKSVALTSTTTDDVVFVTDDGDEDANSDDDGVVFVEDSRPATRVASIPRPTARKNRDASTRKPAAPLPPASAVVKTTPADSSRLKPFVVAAPYHEPLENTEETNANDRPITARRLPTAIANNGVSKPVVVKPMPSVAKAFPPPAEQEVDLTPNNGQPSKRAVEILSQACEAAALAKTEEDFARVVQQCRHVLAIDKTDVVVDYSGELAAWALNKRGELRADANELVDAMSNFNEALYMDSKRWRARHNRGVLFAQAGKYGEAFNDFNAVIQENPKFAKAYSNRASLYVQAGDFTSAINDYQRAISLDPDLAVAHKGRGRVCHMLGKMDEALQHFDAAVLLSPDDAHIAACRADLLVDNGRYGQAVAGYRQAIALDPQLATAFRNLAWLQATCPDERFRDGVSAVELATRALKLTGDDDDVSLDTLAAAHATTGDFDSAVSLIRQAMEVATGTDARAYAQRLQLYEGGQPFLSSPVSTVQQAAYNE